jgi:uncharacterized protein (TIGR01777 family)
MPVPLEELFAWHERRGALERLVPPWQSVRVEKRGGIRDGEEVVLRLGPGPFSLRWVARHENYDPPHSFTDRQVRGPFARWVHQHRFLADPRGSRLEDAIEYELPLAPLGPRLGSGTAQRALERMFRFRHARTRNDLERHARAASKPLRVVVTGATGLVGTALCAFLRTGGHEVLRITRSARESDDVRWDPAAGVIDAGRLDGCDAVVHLAGESLFGLRWSDEKKQAILDSRAQGTRLIAETLARLERPPRVLVSSSAIGYYGDRGDAALDESSPAGEGFLADVCRAWEDAAEPARRAGIRVVNLRLGVVLSAQGGALATMLPAFQLGVAGRLGSGEQWFPWIALDDALGAIQHAIHGTLEGPVNATSPNPVTNAEYTRTLARVLRRPALIPVPASAMRRLLGQLADEMLLSSARVLPSRLSSAGFAFLYPDLESALAFELGRGVGPPGLEIQHE